MATKVNTTDSSQINLRQRLLLKDETVFPYFVWVRFKVKDKSDSFNVKAYLHILICFSVLLLLALPFCVTSPLPTGKTSVVTVSGAKKTHLSHDVY